MFDLGVIAPVTVMTFALFLGGCGDTDSKIENGGLASSRKSDANTMAESIGRNQQIFKLEARLALPEGAYSLDRYDRYYILSGKSFNATYIRSPSGDGSIHIVETQQEIPDILDGGCQIVHISGDISAPESASAFCNGVA